MTAAAMAKDEFERRLWDTLSHPFGMQDGGDAFQGARAAAALEAVTLVLALTFPDTAAVPDFRAPTRPPFGGFWLARPARGCATGE